MDSRVAYPLNGDVAALVGDKLLDRFIQLRRWLRALGVCWHCQDAMAMAQAEREVGSTEVRADLAGCAAQWKCAPVARREWKTMPPAPYVEATRGETAGIQAGMQMWMGRATYGRKR